MISMCKNGSIQISGCIVHAMAAPWVLALIILYVAESHYGQQGIVQRSIAQSHSKYYHLTKTGMVMCSCTCILSVHSLFLPHFQTKQQIRRQSTCLHSALLVLCLAERDPTNLLQLATLTILITTEALHAHATAQHQWSVGYKVMVYSKSIHAGQLILQWFATSITDFNSEETVSVNESACIFVHTCLLYVYAFP